jgi:hypothetical protein
MGSDCFPCIFIYQKLTFNRANLSKKEPRWEKSVPQGEPPVRLNGARVNPYALTALPLEN